MEPKNLAVLTVPIGSVIIDKDNNTRTILGVPDNALDLLEQGATYLILTPAAIEQLAKWDLERLQKLSGLRAKQGFKTDVVAIEKAIDQIKSAELVAKQADKQKK